MYNTEGRAGYSQVGEEGAAILAVKGAGGAGLSGEPSTGARALNMGTHLTPPNDGELGARLHQSPAGAARGQQGGASGGSRGASQPCPGCPW